MVATHLATTDGEAIIPDVFSPKGDGKNAVFEVRGLGVQEFSMEVYNRWADMLFRSVGYAEPWEGKYRGDFVPVGTYYYVVKLNDPRFPDAYTGPLTVIR